MPDEKIQISWNEIVSAEVDAKLKRQDVMGRVQQHYEQPTAAIGPTRSVVGQQRSSFWYHTVVYMALFGLVGGLCAWALGEIAWRTNPSRRFEFVELLTQAQQIEEARKRGEISEAQANAALSDLKRQGKENPFVKIWNSGIPEEEKKRQIEALWSQDSLNAFFVNLAFYGACGAMIALWLGIAESAVSRNVQGAVIYGATGAALGLVGGVIVSLFIDKLYIAMGGGQLDSLGSQIIARAIAWAIIGLFLAIAPGIVLRNWKRLLIGLAGGLIGGFLGGLLFDPIDVWTHSDALGRFLGIATIGLLTGLGTGLIESAAKTGWFRVVSGLIAGKQFILYRNPTVIGSSPQCEIFLFKDVQVAPRHAAIHIVPGGFEIEDLRSTSGTFVNGENASRRRLKNGDQVQVGSTAFSFGEKRQAVGA